MINKIKNSRLGKILILVVIGLALGTIYTLNAKRDEGDIWMLTLTEEYPLTQNGTDYIWLKADLQQPEELTEKDLRAVEAAALDPTVMAAIDGRDYGARVMYYSAAVTESIDGFKEEKSVEYAIVFFVFDEQPSVVASVNMETYQVTKPELEIIDN